MRALAVMLLLQGMLATPARGQDADHERAIDALLTADTRCGGRHDNASRHQLVLRREIADLGSSFWWMPPDVPEAAPGPRLRGQFPGAQQATIDAFLRANEKPRAVAPARIQALGAIARSARQLDDLMRGNDPWAAFRAAFPAAPGIVELADVGFSGDRREAIAYCGLARGPLSGAGFLVLLRRDADQWRAERWSLFWES